MPRFSTRSFTQLSTCHVDLQTLFFDVIKYHDCSVTCGFRNQQDQDAAYAAGYSQLRFPHGNHNKFPSMAVDVYFYPINYKDTKKFYWFAGIVIGMAHKLREQGKMSHGLRWGGNWGGLDSFAGQHFNDYSHFELLP